jgi:hypothetical protein
MGGIARRLHGRAGTRLRRDHRGDRQLRKNSIEIGGEVVENVHGSLWRSIRPPRMVAGGKTHLGGSG